MVETQGSMRRQPPEDYNYHDRVFANEINHHIELTDTHYETTTYREALKTGFYDFQVMNYIVIPKVNCTLI